MMMNRRPKINENNIKLIEKVIKRQNLTAHQDSRANHQQYQNNSVTHHHPSTNISTLLHHQSSNDSQSILTAQTSVFEDVASTGAHRSSIYSTQQSQNNNSRILTTNAKSKSPAGGQPPGILSKYADLMNINGMNGGANQSFASSSMMENNNSSNVNNFYPLDESSYSLSNQNSIKMNSSTNGDAGSTHFMSERIEKTIQKYSKKEILKNSTLNGKQTAQSQQTRNTLYQQQQPNNSISQVQKIYSSAAPITGNTINNFKKHQLIQQQQHPGLNQSPYTNGINTIHKKKGVGQIGGGGGVVASATSSFIKETAVSNQFDEFRQQNSYSVDRKNSENIYDQHQYVVGDKRNQQDNLSFESLNPANNSFTLGGQNIDLVGGQIPLIEFSSEDYPLKQQLQLQQIKIKPHKGVYTQGQTSTQKVNAGSSYHQQQQLDHENQSNSGVKTASSNFRQHHHNLVNQHQQQSPLLLQPMFMNNNSANNHAGGKQASDLFFDDVATSTTQQSTNESSQPLWSQQMLLQHQQQYYQHSLTAKKSAESGGGNAYNPMTMSPIQQSNGIPGSAVFPLQYSKSRDGGYRNIPTRENLSSISDNSPSSHQGPRIAGLHANNFTSQLLFHSDNQSSGYQNNQTPLLKLRGGNTQEATPSQGNNIQDMMMDDHPFRRPKLHLFKKDASRRIKTSSATRNLQPIFPFMQDSNQSMLAFQNNNIGGSPFVNHPVKLNGNNFNSITGVGNEGGSSYNYYPMMDQQKAAPHSSQLQLRKLNNVGGVAATGSQMSTIENNASNTQEIQNKEIKDKPVIQEKITENSQQQVSKQEDVVVQNSAADGFKHSFYNEKQEEPVNSQQNAITAATKIQKKKVKKVSTNKQQPHQQQQQVEQEGSNGEVKQIFVLDEELASTGSHQESLQESKAMTPCFLHTPNMTNKWNDFKPQDQQHQLHLNESIQKIQQIFILQQEQNSGAIDEEGNNNDSSAAPLFIRSGQNNPQQLQQEIQISILGADIKGGALLTQKKPMTSHQTTKSDKSAKQIFMSQQSTNNNQDIIKINPQDIYLQHQQMQQSNPQNTSQSAQTTTKGSRNSLSQKPQTSGGSFRRPLSRNHPMLNLVTQKVKQNTEGANGAGGASGVAGNNAINVLQHLSLQQNNLGEGTRMSQQSRTLSQKPSCQQSNNHHLMLLNSRLNNKKNSVSQLQQPSAINLGEVQNSHNENINKINEQQQQMHQQLSQQ